MNVKERVAALQLIMKEQNIDAYLIPTSDFHESEYVGLYFKCRHFVTGFSGSAGTAVITADAAGLWTDGRYFVQAPKELAGSGIELFKMGEEGVPTVEEYLIKVLPENGVLGFDGRVVNAMTGDSLKDKLSGKNVTFSAEEDLVDLIWSDRPALSAEPVWILDEKYAGKSAAGKIADLRDNMKEAGATTHILTTLDDIVWLLNIRGNDVDCNPVVLSYAAIQADAFYLYINEAVLNAEVTAYLTNLGVTVKPYNDIYNFVKELKGETVMLEKAKTNYAISSSLEADNKLVEQMNPTALAKACKNAVEVENMRKGHIKDGVAVTKFMYWLKNNVGKIPMDELSVEHKLDSLRREQEGNLGLSFHTISAYKENAAMCHYSASPESSKTIEPVGLYLVDSGGQYYEGTTDITRTMAMGPVEQEQKEHFTLVAASMLRLADVQFLYGCRGINFDYVCREVFWKRGLDFNHGTGHGVGYLLNVHERPNGFRWRMVPERMDSSVMEEGMITSDEPGLYFEGSHGIRTENLIVCVKAEKNQYGQFMKFEHLTFAPIDLDAIVLELLTENDRRLLNEYHAAVYEKISPYLEKEEAEWLKEYTRAI